MSPDLILFPRLLRALALFSVLGWAAGCSVSGDTSGDRSGTATPPPSVSTTPSDTISPGLPAGKFTVQVGAYKSGTGAKQVADRAGQRFARTVYTVYDGAEDLFRVMLGVFDTKELARDFRDLIVRQYPDDYKDAWVSELAK